MQNETIEHESLRDNYRDDPGPQGMQAQAAEGSPADRVQAVIADESFHANASHLELVVAIKALVKAIGGLVIVIGIALIYIVASSTRH